MRADNLLKKIRHIPAFFSFGMTGILFLLNEERPPETIGYNGYFYILNYLFVLGIFIYIYLEYRFMDVKSYRFRQISLWTAAFFSLGVIFTKFPLILVFPFIFILLFLSPLILLTLIIFSFIGKQPKITEGRFYPAIFSFLSLFWFLLIAANWT